MDIVRDVTPYVTISKERGGAGNPSPVTAYGVYGDEAAAKHKFGSDSLAGKRVLVQGGHVGEILVEYLTKEGYCNDR
jgi:leucine dehydrogenase